MKPAQPSRPPAAKAVAEYYDSVARAYGDKYLGTWYYRTLYRKLGEVLDLYIRRGMRVLDVGAGTGFWTLYMQARGARVTALDISGESLKACRCGDKAQGDAASLPVRAGAYDAVTALGSVYNHLGDLEKAFAAAAHALRRGGLFIADIDNAVCLDMLYEYLLFQGLGRLRDALIRGVVRGVWESADGELPFNYYSYFYVKSALRRAGLEVVDARPIYLVPPLPSRLLQRRFRLKAFEKFDLLRRLAPLATTVVYVAAKV
ncbi:class I SAM-dependent methyltransferase [Pyrobaculum neutrophilum]|uniref:Methyltransferase type 11 n=1 Tax=Pyrobaculum neutrophilum (strain DSM 2338 / JCM 9278 / NBRC 100436 / V24Sta) TaxID=444157 RepID=B1YAJ1_PYRNV|nr:class I SAM-dependent methyltransferase [Pyrobaculum neutrophilum]ACB40640.1 Methyltransferase type 11 [Pyrobaculum neutrophilum V24Sta]